MGLRVGSGMTVVWQSRRRFLKLTLSVGVVGGVGGMGGRDFPSGLSGGSGEASLQKREKKSVFENSVGFKGCLRVSHNVRE